MGHVADIIAASLCWCCLTMCFDHVQGCAGPCTADRHAVVRRAQDTRLHDKDGSQVVWLPTVALSFLTEVMRARPNHSVVLADFDALPEVQIAGRNAPIVSFTKVGIHTSSPLALLSPTNML